MIKFKLQKQPFLKLLKAVIKTGTDRNGVGNLTIFTRETKTSSPTGSSGATI